MGYFDSAKNRVMWQRELERLKKEKDRRADLGYNISGKASELNKDTPERRKMTFAQLEQEEFEASGRDKVSRSRSRSVERKHDLEMHHEKGLSI